MSVLPRRVTPELLDDLDPADPRARRSRRDLRRVHRAMRSVPILRRMIRSLPSAAAPRSVIELGAGDGTLLLRLARTVYRSWAGVHLTLLDRHDLLADETRAAYEQLGWSVTVCQEDILDWSRPPVRQHYDVCIANLFLHHFAGGELQSVLAGTAARTDTFIGCEPRRDRLGRVGSRFIGLLGANAVTREDAVKSVAAGFTGTELSAVWETLPGAWQVQEYRALPFTHCFTAIRQPPARSAAPDASGTYGM